MFVAEMAAVAAKKSLKNEKKNGGWLKVNLTNTNIGSSDHGRGVRTLQVPVPWLPCTVLHCTVQRSGNDLGSSVHHEARLTLLRRRHEDP